MPRTSPTTPSNTYRRNEFCCFIRSLYSVQDNPIVNSRLTCQQLQEDQVLECKASQITISRASCVELHGKSVVQMRFL